MALLSNKQALGVVVLGAIGALYIKSKLPEFNRADFDVTSPDNLINDTIDLAAGSRAEEVKVSVGFTTIAAAQLFTPWRFFIDESEKKYAQQVLTGRG